MGSPPLGGILGVLPIPIGLGGSLASGGGIPSAIHFWPMNEGTGNTIHDTIGTTNLTASSPVWQVTTGMGASAVLAFNGSTFAQAAIVDATLNFSGSTPFSVGFWCFPSTSTPFTIVGNLTAPTTYEGWEIGSGGSTVGNTLLLVNNVTTNQMTAQNNIAPSIVAQFVVVTYTGSLTLAGVKTYINSAVQSLTDGSGTLSSPFTSAVPLLVGKRADGTNLFTGALAYMRVWNQVLTPTQIAALYALGPQ